MSEWTKKPPTEPGYYFTRDIRYPGIPHNVIYLPVDCAWCQSKYREWWTTPIEEPK